MSSKSLDLGSTRVVDKGGVKHVEEGKGSSSNDFIHYDDAETKKVLRKIDWRLLPVLGLLYLLSYLDRGNIGNAKVAGMNVDLGLTGKQYNLVLTVRNAVRARWCLVFVADTRAFSYSSSPIPYSRYPAT